MQISSSSRCDQEDIEYFLDFLKRKPVYGSDAERQVNDDIDFVKQTAVT